MAAVAALVAAGFGCGVWIAIAGLRGVAVLPAVSAGPVDWKRAAVAVGAGGVAIVVTGWLAAGPAVAFGAARVYRAMTERSRVDRVEVTEAVASWTEMVRDAMVAASGLEEAIVATAPIAPAAIEGEVQRLVARLRHQPLVSALIAFGAEMAHPSCDLVVAALTITARMEANDVASLLSRLAEATRADARMRVRVDVGRARVRTATRVIVGVVVSTAVLLAVFNRGYLDAYDSAGGQVALAAVGSIFAAAGVLLSRMARLDEPTRFEARPAVAR